MACVRVAGGVDVRPEAVDGSVDGPAGFVRGANISISISSRSRGGGGAMMMMLMLMMMRIISFTTGDGEDSVFVRRVVGKEEHV